MEPRQLDVLYAEDTNLIPRNYRNCVGYQPWYGEIGAVRLLYFKYGG